MRLKCVPTATISSAPFSYASRRATSLIPGAGTVTYESRAVAAPPQARHPWTDTRGSRAPRRTKRLVRDGVHVADDDVGPIARRPQRVRAAVRRRAPA